MSVPRPDGSVFAFPLARSDHNFGSVHVATKLSGRERSKGASGLMGRTSNRIVDQVVRFDEVDHYVFCGVAGLGSPDMPSALDPCTANASSLCLYRFGRVGHLFHFHHPASLAVRVPGLALQQGLGGVSSVVRDGGSSSTSSSSAGASPLMLAPDGQASACSSLSCAKHRQTCNVG